MGPGVRFPASSIRIFAPAAKALRPMGCGSAWRDALSKCHLKMRKGPRYFASGWKKASTYPSPFNVSLRFTLPDSV